MLIALPVIPNRKFPKQKIWRLQCEGKEGLDNTKMTYDPRGSEGGGVNVRQAT